MDKITKKTHYLSSIFLLTKPKVEKKEILDKEGVVKSFSKSFFGKDVLTKTYYDTPDKFFKNAGVNISIVNSKLINECSLVVRVEKDIRRVQFLSDMPEKCVIKINPNDGVRMHSKTIVESINTIMPMGLNAPLDNLVNMLVPVIKVVKKRESYRLIGNKGLKVIFSFDKVAYESYGTRVKDSNEQFEIQLDSGVDPEQFNKFVKDIGLQVPTMLRMNSSDIINAYTYTAYKAK